MFSCTKIRFRAIEFNLEQNKNYIVKQNKNELEMLPGIIAANWQNINILKIYQHGCMHINLSFNLLRKLKDGLAGGKDYVPAPQLITFFKCGIRDESF